MDAPTRDRLKRSADAAECQEARASRRPLFGCTDGVHRLRHRKAGLRDESDRAERVREQRSQPKVEHWLRTADSLFVIRRQIATKTRLDTDEHAVANTR